MLTVPGINCAPEIKLAPDDILAIERLIAEFCLRNDRPEFGSVAELFNEDGVLELGTLKLEGREAIDAFFADRNAGKAATGRITRHVCGPLALRPKSETIVEAHCALLVFAGAGSLPLPSEPPSTVADFDCTCQRDASGEWRFIHRKATPLFFSDKASYYVKP